MARNSLGYLATPDNANPTLAPTPNRFTMMPAGSDLSALITAAGHNTSNLTNMLNTVLEYNIFAQAPKQYDFLKDLFMQGVEPVGGLEYVWYTRPFGREALTVYSYANSTTSGIITLSGVWATIPVAVGDTICDNTGSIQVLVTAISPSGSTNTATVTVAPPYGVSLGASSFVVGDQLAFDAAQAYDGGMDFTHADRIQPAKNWNVIRQFQRTRKYTSNEWKIWKSQGAVDFIPSDIANSKEQFLTDMGRNLFDSHKYVFSRPMGSSTYSDFATFDGIYPGMIAGGAPYADVTTNGLISAFKEYSFLTNKKVTGGTRTVYASPRMLHKLSSLFKDGQLLYDPATTNMSSDLMKYNYGGMNFVVVPMQIFDDRSVFGAGWANRFVVVDRDAMKVVRWSEQPLSAEFEIGDFRQTGSNTFDFMRWVLEGNLGIKNYNPTGCFALTVID